MEDKQVRIAQVIGKMNGGGVEAVVMNYYKNIDRSRVQFDFIIDNDSTYIPEKEINKMGGKIYIIPPYQKLHKYIPELISLFKKNNYKIVHCHINTLNIFPILAAKIAKVPIRISHNHSTAGKGEFKKNIVKYMLRPFSKVFPTHFFACSEYAGRWLFGNKFYNSGKVKVINNAIDTSKFNYNEEIRDKTREELGIKTNFVIGHVGRFMKQKNHDFLIDIFYDIYKEEKEAILLLVGEGPLLNEVKEKVSSLNLQEKVIFLGLRNDVNKIMLAMDCFVLPSFYEGLGIVLIEAQTSGLPCTVSNIIPKEAFQTNIIKSISLKKPAKAWADEILKFKDLENRYGRIKEIDNAGFNIINTTKWLENYYIEDI